MKRERIMGVVRAYRGGSMVLVRPVRLRRQDIKSEGKIDPNVTATAVKTSFPFTKNDSTALLQRDG